MKIGMERENIVCLIFLLVIYGSIWGLVVAISFSGHTGWDVGWPALISTPQMVILSFPWSLIGFAAGYFIYDPLWGLSLLLGMIVNSIKLCRKEVGGAYLYFFFSGILILGYLIYYSVTVIYK